MRANKVGKLLTLDSLPTSVFTTTPLITIDGNCAIIYSQAKVMKIADHLVINTDNMNRLLNI